MSIQSSFTPRKKIITLQKGQANASNPNIYSAKLYFFHQLSARMILNGLISSLVLVLLLWRRATGLQHLLQQVELDPRLALVLGDGQVVCQVVVAHQTCERIP